MREVEYLIIGVGTAGLGAYSRIRRKSKSLLLVQHGPFGTTCARVGCMPSKMLVTAGNLVHNIEQGKYFGVDGSYKINGKRIFERLQQDRRDKFVGGVLKAVDKISPELIIQGEAKFVAPMIIAVNGEQIKAKKIILACGSRPYIPTVFHDIEVETTDTIFELEELPKSIIVVGLGVIALELGQALHRLGVKTTLIGHSGRIGPLSHPDLQRITLETMQQELTILPQGEVVKTEMVGSQRQITFQSASGEETIVEADMVLVASGRKSNVHYMDLDKSGLELDERGELRYDPVTMQCKDFPVFVAGDACGDLPLWHEAYDEGRIAADAAITYPVCKKATRRVPLGIYFCDPEIATVGCLYRELDPQQIVIGQGVFKRGPRHEILNLHSGLMHIYADKNRGTILGAEIFGYGAEHFAHYLALAITHQLTVQQVLEAPFYHPCLEEVMKMALNSAAFQL